MGIKASIEFWFLRIGTIKLGERKKSEVTKKWREVLILEAKSLSVFNKRK